MDFTFTELQKEMPAILDSGISVEMISAPGRGKSEFVRSIRTFMSARTGVKWGLATCFLATQDPADMGGLQYKGEMPLDDGTTIAIADPTLPLWMICEDGSPVWAYERGILFLDEYGQGSPETKRTAAELLLNRRIGKWQLPTGWSVIAASNRASDRSGVSKNFDFIINRRLEVHIQDDVEAWVSWANENGVHPMLVAFVHNNPQVVFTDGVPERQGPWPTPRSLVMFDRLMKVRNPDAEVLPIDGGALKLACGLIGEAAAAQLVATMRLLQEMPSYKEIVADPMGCHAPGKDKPDAQMLACYNLAARVVEKDFDAVVAYVERFPAEFAMTFVRAATKRNAKLLSTKTFCDWALRNKAITNAIAKI